ncbi:hypothetical protein [Rhodococcus sp. ABRD24]|nr:hypothetical protein [Rhodococcus sp. ABRD24]
MSDKTPVSEAAEAADQLEAALGALDATPEQAAFLEGAVAALRALGDGRN